MANFLLATVILGLMALSGNALRVSARTRGELSALTLAHSQLAELRQNLQATPTPVSAWPTLSGLGSWHNHPDFAASEYRLDVALQPVRAPQSGCLGREGPGSGPLGRRHSLAGHPDR